MHDKAAAPQASHRFFGKGAARHEEGEGPHRGARAARGRRRLLERFPQNNNQTSKTRHSPKNAKRARARHKRPSRYIFIEKRRGGLAYCMHGLRKYLTGLRSSVPASAQTWFHRQVVNRKLGPVDFCPPFITLLIVKVISLLQQWAYRPNHYCARILCYPP